MFGGKGIPESHRAYTFESWASLPQKVQRQRHVAIQACWTLTREGVLQDTNGTIKHWLILSGPGGLGKTSLATATALELIKTQVVLWVDYNDLLSEVQATYSKTYRGPSKEQLIRAAADAPVLFLDDMGDFDADGGTSDDKRDITYAVIRDRYHRQLTTVITTNFDQDGFKGYFGRRITRRVFARGLWIDMQGDDLTTY